MGNGASVPKNEQEIAEEMSTYAAMWESRDVKGTQTELFRKCVPTEEVDFSGPFRENQLDSIFTSEKLVLPIRNGFNCNGLFRDSTEETKIPIYNNDEFTVLHPLGEPGRDLGENHGSKITHMMVIRHSRDGPITFNEMLPSDTSEMNDLEERLNVLNIAVENMKNDVPITECGSMVMERATNGWNGTPLCGEVERVKEMTIRDYLVAAIVLMPESIRADKLPGYKLFNKEQNEVGKNEAEVRKLLEEAYTNASLKPRRMVQTPSMVSQLLSHIHCYMLESVPECTNESYRDCDVIMKLKKEHMNLDQSEEEEEECDGSLRRTMTNVGNQ